MKKIEIKYNMLDEFRNELSKLKEYRTVMDIACGHGKYSIISQNLGFKTTAIDARNERAPLNTFKSLGVDFKLLSLEDLQVINEDICLLFGIFYHLDLSQQIDLLNKINSKVIFVHTLILNDNSAKVFDLKNRTTLGNLDFAIYKEGNKRDTRTKASMNNYFSVWHSEESLKNMFLNAGFKTFEKLKDITIRSGFYKATK